MEAPIVDQVISACISLGATIARPGAFSERAFLNGKIDLIQAESIADLIASRTAVQAQAALSSLSGALSERVNSLQARLTAIRVQVEASIDFAEQDISTDGIETTRGEIKKVLQKTEQLIHDVHRAIHSQEGIRVAIVGAPNAGKSSLLNYLAQQERAIVTDIPGTTRDIIDLKITHNGHYLEVLDTAGIRSTDPVEKIGVQKTREAIKVADIVWLIFDTTRPTKQDIIDQVREIKETTSGQLIVVGNKIDCGMPKKTLLVDAYISAKSGQNISALLTIP